MVSLTAFESACCQKFFEFMARAFRDSYMQPFGSRRAIRLFNAAASQLSDFRRILAEAVVVPGVLQAVLPRRKHRRVPQIETPARWPGLGGRARAGNATARSPAIGLVGR